MQPQTHTTNNAPQGEYKRTMPQSELDFHLMTTNAVWGEPQVNVDLQERLRKVFLKRDEKGKPLYDKDGKLIGNTTSLWGMLGFYTRDMRLANLALWNGEVQYVQYFLDLANDLLQADMLDAFIIALSRSATLLEISQSKGGFLRRQMNTITQQHLSGEMEAPKKKLFGGNEKKNLRGF